MKISQYEPLFDAKDLTDSFSQYFQSGGWMTEFKQTQKFEETIAKFVNKNHCITVNNGTISLSLALLALGIKPGDRVAIPAISMIATANAVKFIGAKPVFVDVNYSLLMDARALGRKIKQVKAVIYVSLNGRYTGCKDVVELCKAHEVPMIEDAAQSLGCNPPAWMNYCAIRSFSFSMPKIVTTGQGGCLVTDFEDLNVQLRKLKDFGRVSGGLDIHDTFGINSKFTDLQALVGLSQFRDIEWRIKQKKHIYELYQRLLSDVKQISFFVTDLCYTTPWFVDILLQSTGDRESLIQHLKALNIETRPMYPVMPKQKCYNNKGQFPVAMRLAPRGLWLPSSLSLTDEQISTICNEIKGFYV